MTRDALESLGLTDAILAEEWAKLHPHAPHGLSSREDTPEMQKRRRVVYDALMREWYGTSG